MSPSFLRRHSRVLLLSHLYFSTNTAAAAPPPIRVGFTESAGRGVFATRNIAAGELIHTAQPIVSHPSSLLHKSPLVCYYCLANSNNPQSSSLASNDNNNNVVTFCSQLCLRKSQNFHDIERMADWSSFHDYCSVQGLKYPLLVKRLACQVICGDVSPDVLDILQPEAASPERISLMEQGFLLLRRAFKDTVIQGERLAFLSKEWYIGVLARIRVNAFRVELVGGGSYEDFLASAAASVEAEAAVGNAVYMLPSFYNHDCDPNTHIVWIKSVDAQLKALRDIEGGEELRICYVDASMDYKARQTILYQGYGFQCNCSRCLSKD